MSMAYSWEATPAALPSEITKSLTAGGDPRLQALKLLAAMPEYQVSLSGGQTSSQTDVLALATNEHGLVVLAVEGKVDEPFGPTLGEKRAEASAGQNERLAFLHKVLGLDKPLPDQIRYQLLHRTASAILVAEDFHAATAVMMVHSFSPQSQWFDNYSSFCEELGAQAIKGHTVVPPGHASPALYLGWCSGA